MATITVTTLDDSTATDGQVSLREAIQAANTNASVDGSAAGSIGTPDTIVFDPTVFTGGATNLIRLTLGEITISGAVTIDGSTAGGVIITGDANDDDVTLAGTDITDVAASYGGTPGAADDLLDDNARIFNIAAGADTTLQGLTLTGGRTTAVNARGGAISAQAALTLIDSTVSGNSTAGTFAHGGGIAGDAVTLTNSTVSGNATTGSQASGGGIFGTSTVTLTDSTVSGNATAGFAANGGGLHASTVELTNSTVSGNATAGDQARGGGIFGTSTVTLTDSTVSGNATAGFAANGGGLHASTVELTNSTVSGNATTGSQARGGGILASAVELTNSTVSGNSTAGFAADGGGIWASAVELTNSTLSGNSTASFAADGGGIAGDIVTLTNSIVLGNNGAQTTADEISSIGTVTYNGLNIVGTGADTNASDHVINANPTLVFANTVANGAATAGVLANNGGPVATIALNAAVTNPALDAGSDGLAPALDARGFSRADVAGVAHNGANISDLGAFEVSHSIVVTTRNDVVDATDGLTSLREAVALANSHAGADTITFDAAVFAGGAANLIRLVLGEIAIGGAVTIDGSAVGGVTITGDKNDDDVTLPGTDITNVAASGAAHLADNSRIFVAGADTTLQGLTLTGGRTTAHGADGGAVRSQSILTLIDSTVSGNSTTGDDADGGGVYGTTVTLTNSTVSGNSTAGTIAYGGGIFGIAVTLTNSTVSGNSATGDLAGGGGIYGATVTLTNSTVSGNSTAGIDAYGGGILIFGLAAVTLTNSIVLGNNSAQTTSDEISGAITYNGLNIVGTGADTDPSDHVINADPTLVFANTVANGAAAAGVLANNGGPVRTIALKLDTANPALDASNASAPVTDARGLGRVDQLAIANANSSPADLGAFELQGTFNGAPVNTLPGAQNIEANTATAISGLSVADPDSAGAAITTTLSVAHGTLTVASAGGAAISGSGTGTVTLSGTVAQINATLAGNNVVYKGAHDFFGTDTLTVSTNDNGNTGASGPLTDTDSVTLNINTLITGTPGNDSYNALPGQERIDAGLGIDTITFDFRLVDASVKYEDNKVIIDGPGGSHTVLTGFEVFNFTDGTVNNNDGSPLIDDLFYYSKYHDVWNAHADADAHYNTFGWHEGRDPDALFSTVIYLSANPDVKAAGLNPLTHFDTGGWKEGRVPSITFDPAAYLAANPDVAAANVDPLRHYLAFGYQEGREPIAPSELIGATGFDYVYYLQRNPDVAAANVDPLAHFQQFGWKEGRNPNALFDVNGYLNTYADVKAANINPLDHYNTFGWHEGRDPSVGFDTTSYLAAYANVAAAHLNPLAHFLQFGVHEGRSSFADGVWG